MNNRLILKALFACMACDGEVSDTEVKHIELFLHNNNLFEKTNVRELMEEYVAAIKNNSKEFFLKFFEEITHANFSEVEELTLISNTIGIIESDNDITYSEVKFFKAIRSNLKVSNETILMHNPDKEDYLLEDIKVDNYLSQYLDSVKWENNIVIANH